MRLTRAIALVGGERAIDSLCTLATVASPLPVAELMHSVQQIRAEQPRVVARLMDSPVSPSLGPDAENMGYLGSFSEMRAKWPVASYRVSPKPEASFSTYRTQRCCLGTTASWSTR